MRVVKYDDDSESERDTKDILNVYDVRKQRAELPMYQVRAEGVEWILGRPVTVLVGATGSGKSTQLPQALLEHDNNQRIVVTQPRRVAAMALAERVAQECGKPVGKLVGYQVRFAAKVSADTKIRYVTDGMLLREVMLHPNLERYTTVIVDEAHERTVVTDLLLGLLKRLILRRKDIRVVVMSATIDAARFAEFFGPGTPVLWVPGRQHPVQRFVLEEPVPSITAAAAKCVRQVNRSEPLPGDILVFLPGQEEIEATAESLRESQLPANEPHLSVIPLYAALSEKEQRKAFQPALKGHRKVVLATNIAETSVTISGVRYVVDSGLRKVRVHRSALGLDSLLPAAVSQASAAQRMGRAGREAPGKCWRLFTENQYLAFQEHTEPEITRVSIDGPILTLACAGVTNPLEFDWIDPPRKQNVRQALLHLYSLGALDDNGQPTQSGRRMATLPVDPSLACVLLGALGEDPEVSNAVFDVAACLSVQDLLIVPSADRRDAIGAKRMELFPAAAHWGDLVLVKQLWDSYESLKRNGAKNSELKDWCQSVGVSLRGLRGVSQVRQQLAGYLNFTADFSNEAREESGPEFWASIIRAFLRGFVTNTGLLLSDNRYHTIMTQQPIAIHPGSALFGRRPQPETIMYLEYVYTTKGYARLVSPIEREWLTDVAPHLLARGRTKHA